MRVCGEAVCKALHFVDFTGLHHTNIPQCVTVCPAALCQNILAKPK